MISHYTNLSNFKNEPFTQKKCFNIIKKLAGYAFEYLKYSILNQMVTKDMTIQLNKTIKIKCFNFSWRYLLILIMYQIGL